uniref:winged helix-turn-helix transcriptional regulator n=1 Tax=Nocardia cyriacigeorgica TaxID=135487 RepID=UPI002454A337
MLVLAVDTATPAVTAGLVELEQSAGAGGGPAPRGPPTRQVLDHIAGKWTILVVAAHLEGTMRYTDLSRRIEGVSQKMLTQ